MQLVLDVYTLTEILKCLNMRKIIFFIPLLLLLSCAKDEQSSKKSCNDTSSGAYEKFSVILSKAVSSEPDLRSFIKTEALKQFDKDYDVFYPYVKNKRLPDGRTFRECLLEYSNEQTLTEIENTLPLLDILVPDWSWLDSFDVNDWDTSSDDILVGFVDGDGNHMICEKGQKSFKLDAGVFLDVPTLIVKDCERMKVVATKTGEGYEYAFSDEAFNPHLTKKVAVESSYIHPSTTPGSNWVEASSFEEMCPEAVRSWEEYGSNPYEIQRKYAYYCMKKGDTLGKLNPQIRESVLAIRLNNTTCIDDDDDPNLKKTKKEKSDYDNEEEIINALWSDGQFEIKLHASVTDGSGTTVILNDNVIPADGKDLFDISTIKREFRHKTWTSSRSYTYIASLSDLEPKWYYLPSPLAFTQWDPLETSTIMNIHAYEVDPSETKDVTDSVKTQKGASIAAKIKDWVQISFNSNSKIETKVAKYKVEKGSDDLGQKEFRFSDQIVLAKKDDSYKLTYYSTGKLDFIVVPQSNVK